MRAAALLGLGSVARSVATFQRLTGAEWTSLIEQADVAVIFGGDGTVHRHLSELVQLEIPVLVVPCGSGNDFARALKIRSVKDAARAWSKFAAGGKARGRHRRGNRSPGQRSPQVDSRSRRLCTERSRPVSALRPVSDESVIKRR